MMMASFTAFHGLFLLVMVAIFAVPMWKIVTRTGNPGIATLLFFIPLVNIVALWWLAYGRWPALDEHRI
jgi:hypothetical protein